MIGKDSVPSEDISKCEKWFDDVSEIYNNEVTNARTWLSDHGIDVKSSIVKTDITMSDSENTDTSHVETLSKELATLLSLPKLDIVAFNGDPCEYHSFISTFDQMIGNAALDDQAKLTRLLKYLSGEAASAVKSCSLIGGTAGYSQARSVLKSRFGNPQLVMRKIVDNLRHGRPVTKSTELRMLADDVATAHQTLTKLGACGEVNNQQFIHDVLMRCHAQVRSRWRKYALDIYENKAEYPSFKQFVDFVERVAREACDPVYGYDAFKVNTKAASVNFVSSSARDIPADVPAHDVMLTEYSHLADLPLPNLKKGAKAEVIIGQDNADLLVPFEVRQSGKSNQPYATRTWLGWALQGPIGGDYDLHMFSNNHICLEQINEQVENLWHIECENETLDCWSVHDQQVYDKWQVESFYDAGRYTVPPAWRPGKPCFPNNLSLAETRLQCTVKKLHKTDMYDAYDEGIKTLVANGQAEPVPAQTLARNDGAVWYLPHHVVLSPAKPGKLRIVFDCAAKYAGVSLNSECFRGPDLVNKLLHVLLRFRQYQYAVTADIQSMYLQVRIPVDDRDCLRFLWFKDGKISHYRMTSHLFGGVWCASSTTYALRRTLDDFMASDLVRDAVCKSMYVDDLLRSLATKDEMSQLVNDIKVTLEKGGFPLTKFIINDSDLLSQIPENDRAQEVKIITAEQYSKALGIGWDVVNDQFSYVRSEVDTVPVITKRHMLSSVASMYDPLGLIIPIIIQGRILCQRATKEKLTWDEAVPQGLLDQWLSWWDCLCDISSLRFDRCIVPDEFVDGAIEFHHFCDGSQLAYGVCSYVRILSKSGAIHIQLLMGKARLTPINPITIPRIELCAAAMAVKVDEVLRSVLELSLLPNTFWSDSQTVLSYIKSDAHRFRVFVANRVSLIRSKSRVDQWHHVASEINPADVLSRGCTPKALPDVWINGPDFLRRHRDAWPAELTVRQDLTPGDPEVKKSVCLASTIDDASEHPLDTLISHYSDYHRLRKALAWLLRLPRILKEKTKEDGILHLDELKHAEDLLIRRVQSFEYPDEIKNLQDGKQVNCSSHIVSLDPILVDGKLVVGGRLKHSPLSHAARHPVILPPRHRFSRLVLSDAHNQAHLGTEWVLSNIRSRFWIPGARNSLRTIRHSCVTCQRLYGQPRHQKMADLPVELCSPRTAAFVDVGVDLFGPFYVSQGRSTVKRYGCVFTCLAVRAIHIEVLPSLDTDSFINGFRRFCARRGHPQSVRSDRGTNLVGACTELSAEARRMDKKKIVTTARRMDVDWTFNPPLASHHGGVWERMIRTIRKVLLAVMPVTSITDDVLRTTFCEVENIVNGRPLTKCSADVCDDSPLTPNHFLLLEANYPAACRKFYGGEVCRKQWKFVQNIVTSFWKRWTKEYLASLQRRQKWTETKPNYEKGDLVLLVDEPWLLAFGHSD